MKKLLLTLLCIFTYTLIYSQVQDTTLSTKYARSICLDTSREDCQESVNYFMEVIKEDSTDLEAYYNLGMSYYKLLDFEKSIAVYDQLIEKDFCFNYALYNRALCKFFLKNTEGACKDFKKALQCDYPDMSGIKEEFEKFCK